MVVTTYASAYGKPVREIDAEAMELLVDYNWPGNIRELENVIQSIVVLSEGETIRAKDLPENMQRPGPILVSDSCFESEPQSFEERLREFKISVATQAVVDCNGNKTHAAQKLSISRAYLHRILRSESRDLEIEYA